MSINTILEAVKKLLGSSWRESVSVLTVEWGS